MEVGCERELRRTDAIGAALLFLVALALHLPFRSRLAYEWDSAQFALAVGDYNIRISQPHAPGFYLYVMLGRWMNRVVDEPHTALVWVSVIAGAWLVAMGYLLGTSLFGRRCGLGSGLILLTSPLCWFHSEVALTNMVDGALVATFVLVSWRAIQKGVTWSQTVALAALLAVVAGVRQQTAPQLIPLWLYVFWKSERARMGKLVCATGLTAIFSLGWFLPTLKSAGGLMSYLELLRLKSQFDSLRTVWGGGGVEALLTNISWTGRSCWVGLLGAGIIAAAELSYWVFFEDLAVKRHFYLVNKAPLFLIAFWTAPMLLFGFFFMYVARPGHVLSFFPAFAVLASLGLARLSEQLTVRPALIFGVGLVVIVIINTIVFVWLPRPIAPFVMGLRVTNADIARHDAELSACFQAIRENWPRKDVIVCHQGDNFYWGFRQFEYHLPEYHTVQFTTDASLPGNLSRKKWLGYQRQTTFQNEIFIATNQEVVLFVPPGQSLDAFKPYFDLRNATLLMDCGPKLYRWHS